VQQSRGALTRRAAVLIFVDVICAKLELQVLKVGRLSVGWFMLVARPVRAHLDVYTLWGATQ